MAAGCLSVTSLGMSCLILEWGEKRILVDPFLSSGGLWVVLPGRSKIDPVDLLPLHAVLITHMHRDHYEPRVLAPLPRNIPVVVPAGEEDKPARLGFTRILGLTPGKEVTLFASPDTPKVICVPARHLITRAVGYVVEWDLPAGSGSKPKARLYLAGDTLLGPHLKEIADLGPLDLACLPVVGFQLLGMKMTMNSAEAVEAAKILNPRVVLPVHHDYRERWPVVSGALGSLELFLEEARAAGLAVAAPGASRPAGASLPLVFPFRAGDRFRYPEDLPLNHP